MTDRVETIATRDLTADEVESVSGGWMNACMALMAASSTLEAADKSLQAGDKLGNFEVI
jgi:hypothetical protein